MGGWEAGRLVCHQGGRWESLGEGSAAGEEEQGSAELLGTSEWKNPRAQSMMECRVPVHFSAPTSQEPQGKRKVLSPHP